IDLLDMCCGSGVIGISTKLNFANKVNLTLVDINDQACINCKKNLNLHNLNANIICSNLFDNLDNNKYDVIVCNPPYISFDDDIGLVEKYDPTNALFAENNGYLIYEKIISNYSKYIKNNEKFLFAFEIGKGQEEKIKHMLLTQDSKIKVDVIKDYNNINRFIFAYKNYDI
ncbi:MAG: methyltransferase, partial [Ureaplasma sp.]|nr:methyltransferase [Ureaplasma sp.]